MSLVMAMQFGDRICILSDSMISDSNVTDRDVIPGQLKTIVLDERIAVSFSGQSDRAIGKIREIREDLTKRVYFEEILESLTDFTGEDGSIDFIVSSHVSIPKLYKIADGQIHYGLDMYWIGNPDAVSRVREELGRGGPVHELPPNMTEPEYRFREAFKKVVSERKVPQAGGLVFDCVGSPEGYFYNNHAAVHAGKNMPLDISFDYTPQSAHEKPGMEFSLVSPSERSLAVTGAFFEQSNTGFIYSPLDPGLDFKGPTMLGRPERVYPVTLQGFVNEVERYATRLEVYLGG